MKLRGVDWLISRLRCGPTIFTIGLQRLAAAMLIFIVLIITVEVVGRTVFGFSTGFTHELVGVLTASLLFASLTATFKEGSHIRILAFVVHLPKKARFILDVFAHVFCLIFICCLLVYAPSFAFRSFECREQSWAAVSFQVWPFKFILLISLLTFGIVVAGQTYTLVFKSRKASAEQRLSD